MDKEILESLFDTIDNINKRVNKLDKQSNDYNSQLVLLKTELLREIDNVVSKEISKLPKPTESNKDNLAIYQSLLSKDLDKFDTQVKKDISSLGSKLGTDVKNSLEATVKAYVASIRDTLKGDRGRDGKDGQRGLQGPPGASIKGDKGDKGDPGKDAVAPKLPDIKKLIKEEVAKIELPKAEVFPVAPVPQSSLSMIAVKKEIDEAISNINITGITESSTDILTNKTLDSYTNVIHADTLHKRVKNVSGSTIPKGTAVCVTGYNNGENAVEVDIADNTVSPSNGITEEELANNGFGLITVAGVLEGYDCSDYLVGEILYVNGSGQLTNQEPTSGYVQPIAMVLKNVNNGAIQVLAAYPKNDIGWKDLVAFVGSAAPSPSNRPTLTNFGAAGTMQRMEYAFAAGEYVFLNPYHINHDINPNAPMYLHVHWTTDGTDTGSVIWRLHIQRALGHNQAAFGTPYYIQLEQNASGIAYQHMVTEVNMVGATTTTSDGSDPILYTIEPDELIMVTLEREGGTNTDTVFGLQVDLHYQSARDVTPNRSPNFYSN